MKWKNWMMKGEKTYKKGGNIQTPALATLCIWIEEAWDEIKSEIVMKSFKKCGISNAFDGTEDDLLWDDQANDDVNEEDDINDRMADDVDPYDDTLHTSEWEELYGEDDVNKKNDFVRF